MTHILSFSLAPFNPAYLLWLLIFLVICLALGFAYAYRNLNHANKNIKYLLEQSDNLIYLKNKQKQYVYANKAFLHINEIEFAQLYGKTDEELQLPFYRPRNDYEDHIWKTNQQLQINESLNKKNSAKTHTLHTIKFLLPYKTKGEYLICSIASLKSNYLILAQEEKSRHYDPLTKLPSSNMLEQKIHTLLTAPRQYGPVAIMLISIDNLNRINNAHSYAIGDIFLKNVAQRLEHLIKKEDYLARLNSNKFAVLMKQPFYEKHAQDNYFYENAYKIKKELESPYAIHHIAIQGMISMGLNLVEKEQGSPARIIQNTYLALSQARKNHAGKIHCFNQQLSKQLKKTLQLATELPFAIKRNQLKTFVHPQHNMQGKLVGVELLMRWHHPTYGYISPNRFIPMAERDNIIHSLGLWMLNEAARFIEKYHEEAISVSVNVSPLQFHSIHFSEFAAYLKTHANAMANRLIIELTEGALMKNTNEANRTMQFLTKLGYRFSLDDFGTGYSNFAALSTFPLYEIKLDRSLVSKIAQHKEHHTIAAMVATLAKALHLRSVAEGVETQEQLEILQTLGFDMVQGFYFAKPMSMKQWDIFLKNATTINKPRTNLSTI